MYEETETPDYRRIILAGVSIIVIIAIIWVLVWLVFFRGSAKVAAPHRPATSQSQSTKSDNGKASKPTSNAKSGTAPQGQTAQGQINAPGQSATASPGSNPSQLANTGPGDVFLPVGTAVAVGTALYYARLRKKVALDA